MKCLALILLMCVASVTAFNNRNNGNWNGNQNGNWNGNRNGNWNGNRNGNWNGNQNGNWNGNQNGNRNGNQCAGMGNFCGEVNSNGLYGRVDLNNRSGFGGEYVINCCRNLYCMSNRCGAFIGRE